MWAVGRGCRGVEQERSDRKRETRKRKPLDLRNQVEIVDEIIRDLQQRTWCVIGCTCLEIERNPGFQLWLHHRLTEITPFHSQQSNLVRESSETLSSGKRGNSRVTPGRQTGLNLPELQNNSKYSLRTKSQEKGQTQETDGVRPRSTKQNAESTGVKQ